MTLADQAVPAVGQHSDCQARTSIWHIFAFCFFHLQQQKLQDGEIVLQDNLKVLQPLTVLHSLTGWGGILGQYAN